MDKSLYFDAVRLSTAAGFASASLLRCCCRISYVEAVEMIDRMEAERLVGPAVDANPRKIDVRRATMQLQQPFDARQVEPAAFPPPPTLGDYHVRISDSDAKATKDNQGGYVEFQLEILDPGNYQGRKIPYRLNLFNASQQTVEIAYRQLSAVCWVTGVFNVSDTRQLHGIPFIATIGPQQNNPQYSNVFQVKDINGNLPGKAGQAAAQTQAPPAQPPQAVGSPPAWGAMPSTHPPAGPPPAMTQAPPAWGAQQPPAWNQPPAAAAAPPAPPAYAPAPPAAPAWQPPGPPQAPAAAQPPAWGPPQAPPQAQQPPAAAPPWAPQAAPQAPPWVK